MTGETPYNKLLVIAGFRRCGDYIVEDMERGGLRNVNGVNFTDASKNPWPSPSRSR